MERWQRIEQIFHEALGRDAAARESYVSDACRGDGELFREVSSLPANHGDDGDLESWASSAAAQLVVEEALLERGHRLGPYRIDAFLAAGGMGQVYRATDTRLNRAVAITVSPSRFSEHFETEARAVASRNLPRQAAESVAHLCRRQAVACYDSSRHGGPRPPACNLTSTLSMILSGVLRCRPSSVQTASSVASSPSTFPSIQTAFDK